VKKKDVKGNGTKSEAAQDLDRKWSLKRKGVYVPLKKETVAKKGNELKWVPNRSKDPPEK